MTLENTAEFNLKSHPHRSDTSSVSYCALFVDVPQYIICVFLYLNVTKC